MAAGMLSGRPHSSPRQFMTSTSPPAAAEMSTPDAFASCARLQAQPTRDVVCLGLLWHVAKPLHCKSG